MKVGQRLFHSLKIQIKQFLKHEINQHFIVITIEHFTNHFRGRRMNESVRDFI